MTGATETPSNGTLAEPSVDRAAAFAAGPARIPRNFVYLLLCAAAVLGIGGVLLEHVLSAVGLNPAPTGVTTPAPRSAPHSSTAAHKAPVRSALASFMGLSRMTPSRAGPISLVDENGRTVSLAGERGKVVVLSFFNGPCNDICPVVAAEIRQADADLGSEAARVSFLTINTDPDATAVTGLARTLSVTGLDHLPNWHMLTGPLGQLNTVWQAYGITVSLDTVTRVVAHNDLMYFIDRSGRFRFSATPFADESRSSATYSLPSSDIARFANGIATYAAKVAGDR